MGILHKIKAFWRFRQYFSSTGSWLQFCLLRLQDGQDCGKVVEAGGNDKRLVHFKMRGIGPPVILRRHTTDYRVCREIFVDGEYDILLRRIGGDVRTILDLGANIGLFTRFALHHFPYARIGAVEPDPGNMMVCRENIRLSGQPSRVALIAACAAGRSRRVGLSQTGGEWAYKMVETRATEPTLIEAMTIPQIAVAAGIDGDIDILKCDVEGVEQEIFTDCAAWIGRVRYLLVELHRPYGMDDFLADIKRSGAPLHVLESSSPKEPNVVLLLAREQT